MPDAKLYLTILLVVFIVMTGMDVGCYLVNVAPLKEGQCMKWASREMGGSYVLAPCPEPAR